MNKDPYSILGVGPNASESEVKEAYRGLVRKYHPDNYPDGDPLREVANEKMQEVNWAYDEIARIRQNNRNNFGGYNQGGFNRNNYYGTANQGDSYQSGGTQDPIYIDIRADINDRKYADAESKLLNIAIPMRVAEWHYLMSLILCTRNMINDAVRELEIACSMDPTNVEYQKAKTMFNTGNSQYGNTYYGSVGDSYNRRSYRRQSDMDRACNCCSNLICLDCCCECMGGDFISCI